MTGTGTGTGTGAAPRRALVIGAGPAGLAAALALRAAGVEPTVYEQASGWRPVGVGLTLWPNALAALAAFGADQVVRDAGAPAEGNTIRSDTGEHLDVVPGWQLRELGGTGIALLRSDLVDGLRSLLGPDLVRVGHRCVGFRSEPDRVVARFADGAEAAGDLLVGADGIRSVVRAALLRGNDRLRYAGFPVWRGAADFDLGEAPGTLTMGAGGQFGLFPMRDGTAYWFASVPMAAGRAAAVPARRFLLGRFGDWHEPIRDVISATEDGRITVTDIYDRRPLRRWGAGRVTLVGDAAHPSTPNLGQGTCQAFEDAAVLGRCFGRPGADGVETALREYEAARRRRANGMTRQARRLGQLGQWRHPLACRLREQLLRRAPRGPRMRQLRRMFEFP